VFASGSTALHVACLSGNQEGVEHLLAHGARADIPNEYCIPSSRNTWRLFTYTTNTRKGQTPLMCACHNGHVAAVSALSSAGGVNLQDNKVGEHLHAEISWSCSCSQLYVRYRVSRHCTTPSWGVLAKR
jgi:ankyrin repeat protein